MNPNQQNQQNQNNPQAGQQQKPSAYGPGSNQDPNKRNDAEKNNQTSGRPREEDEEGNMGSKKSSGENR